MKSRGIALELETCVGIAPDTSVSYDLSRYKNNGTLANITWSKLASGLYVRNFNGSSSLQTIASGTSLNFTATQDFTIYSWVNLTSQAGYHTIMDKQGYRDALEPGWALKYNDAGPTVDFHGADGVDLFSSTMTKSLHDGDWHFVAGKADRSGNATVQVDLVDGTPASMAAIGDITIALSVMIGRRNSAAGHWTLGQIGQQGIFRYLLTDDELNNIYQKTRFLYGA